MTEYEKAKREAAEKFHNEEFGFMEEDSIYRVCYKFGADWSRDYFREHNTKLLNENIDFSDKISKLQKGNEQLKLKLQTANDAIVELALQVGR